MSKRINTKREEELSAIWRFKVSINNEAFSSADVINIHLQAFSIIMRISKCVFLRFLFSCH